MKELTGKMMVLVAKEGERQDQLKAQGRFQYTCADRGVPDSMKLAILVEEVGEVARHVCDRGDLVDMKEELIQVAAVAVAWAERISEKLEEA